MKIVEVKAQYDKLISDFDKNMKSLKNRMDQLEKRIEIKSNDVAACYSSADMETYIKLDKERADLKDELELLTNFYNKADLDADKLKELKEMTIKAQSEEFAAALPKLLKAYKSFYDLYTEVRTNVLDSGDILRRAIERKIMHNENWQSDMYADDEGYVMFFDQAYHFASHNKGKYPLN